MDSSSFQFPLSYLSLGFMLLILLNSPPASSAFDEWFLNCTDSSNCESIPVKEFPLWRNYGTGSCGYFESMKVQCEGSRATIEILGAKFQVLGFSTKDEILIIGDIDFSDRFCPSYQNISSSSIYSIILVSYDCGHPQNPDKPTCSVTDFSYIPFKNGTSIADAYCVVSVVVPISPSLLKEVGDDLQKVAQHSIQEFRSEAKVEGKVCRNCSVAGGVCGYQSQTRCYCQSSSKGFDVCPSSLIAASAPYPYGSEMSPSLRKKIFIAAASALGSIILIILITIIFFIYHTRKRKNTWNKDEIEETIRRYSTQIPKRYTYAKLKKITDSFQNKLGQGGFSIVYKGKLPDGRDVAVKLLNKSKENGQDFINEVISITRTSHVNIVTFLGFCYEGNKRALIYEYMPKGSLNNYIFHKNKAELNWSTLYSIIVGVARGLE